MAMLMMNDVFTRTWGDRVGPAPDTDYWPTVIPAVRAHHPGFLFLAEAYWDLEWALQQQGFDYCYDKRLYDRLAARTADAVRGHLLADLGYQEHLVRFVENHDEPRAAAAFGARQAPAAAVATLTQTGARLIHDGQLRAGGRGCRCSSAGTPTNRPTTRSPGSTAAAGRPGRPDVPRGRWELCDRSGWPGSGARTWSPGAGTATAAGWSWSTSATGRDRAGPGALADLRGRRWRLTDPTQESPSNGPATTSSTGCTSNSTAGTGTCSASTRSGTTRRRPTWNDGGDG